jgi:hypothetical protein
MTIICTGCFSQNDICFFQYPCQWIASGGKLGYCSYVKQWLTKCILLTTLFNIPHLIFFRQIKSPFIFSEYEIIT